MSVLIHPSAIVSEKAQVAPGVEIGPLCVVGDDVVLGEGTKLISSCTVMGPTVMGRNNVLHPYCVIGGAPQDLSYRGEATRLEIGDANVFREGVTVNRGTVKDSAVTKVGSRGLFMAGAHIAHDCVIGDSVILANATLLGGHVHLGDGVVTGGAVALAPFVKVGRLAFLAGGACVEKDVPPFVIAAGDRARVRALNRVGLMRAGVSIESQKLLEKAFKVVFTSGLLRAEALIQLEQMQSKLLQESEPVRAGNRHTIAMGSPQVDDSLNILREFTGFYLNNKERIAP